MLCDIISLRRVGLYLDVVGACFGLQLVVVWLISFSYLFNWRCRGVMLTV